MDSNSDCSIEMFNGKVVDYEGVVDRNDFVTSDNENDDIDEKKNGVASNDSVNSCDSADHDCTSTDADAVAALLKLQDSKKDDVKTVGDNEYPLMDDYKKKRNRKKKDSTKL